MKKKNNHFMNTLKSFGSALLVIAILIAAYGIYHAPTSDTSQLKAELEQNERELAREEATPANSPKDTPAGTAAATPSSTTGVSDISQSSLSVIGDSVFLGAAPAFKKLCKNAVIDAKVSRQVVQAMDVAKSMDKKGKLGDTVIIALGTNGNFNSATGQKLIDYLGPDRTIYWIDAYGRDLPGTKDVNNTIRRVAKANNNVHVIAWSKEGPKHPDWFYQDGIHLNITGQKKFAKFVQKNMITE